jgi:hypothetical protein
VLFNSGHPSTSLLRHPACRLDLRLVSEINADSARGFDNFSIDRN